MTQPMMMQFSFGYGADPDEAMLTAMQPFVREPMIPYKKYTRYTGMFPQLFDIIPKGTDISIQGGTESLSSFEMLCVRLAAIESAISVRPMAVNERCNVTVPGLGTLLIDDVQVFYDYCTESLQDRLGEGWRILAVCVQPDQRRPDYVLGRIKEKE